MINTKTDFPIFNTYPELVYLDSAATSQKPQEVIDAVSNFYTHANANVNRGIYALAEKATELYENIRVQVADFIGADSSEIVFTGNTNESINLVAFGWGRKFLKKGDIIVLSEMEHHANIVPWQRLQQEIGIELHYLPINKDFRLDYKSLLDSSIEFKKVKIVTLTHVSNVLGTINPIQDVITSYKNVGIEAKYVVDAAQSVPHFTVNVSELGCDFLAFSSHKMLGPSGVGVLWAKKELLEEMDPLFVGSQMIKKVTQEAFEWTDIPGKFEVGTGKLEGVAGLGAAVTYIKKVDMNTIFEHDREIGEYALKELQKLDFIEIYGSQTMKNRLGIFSFNINDVHAHDVAQILDRFHIAVRSGHHCAQPLMRKLGVSATARASLYLYNSKDDVDKLIEGLKNVKKTLRV